MILQKLKIKAPHILCTINAPNDFVKTIGKLAVMVSLRRNVNANLANRTDTALNGNRKKKNKKSPPHEKFLCLRTKHSVFH